MSRSKIALAFALTALLAAVPASGQTRVANDREMAFKPGETLRFAVSYGPVPAGSMELRVVERATLGERPAYHFASEVESNRAVSYVYQIESREEAWLDADRLHSLKYRRDAVEKGWEHAYRDRKKKKRNYRRLWIARINAAARELGLTYSRFMNGLDRAGVEVDRKALADLAVMNPDAFAALADRAKAELAKAS